MLKTPELHKIKVTDGFLSRYRAMIPEKIIPYQWDILNDRVPGAEKSYCIHNFKAAKGMGGGHKGTVFLDSDLYKWLECVAYTLHTEQDEKLEALADEAIGLIEGAQGADGYVNTFYALECPEKRWTNLQEGHELYCAGHLIEAAVAYFQATGKDRFLRIACRFSDHIDETFGADGQKRRGYPGHQVIELALVKLWRVTGNERYIKLAKYFIDERGKEPNYFDRELESPDFKQIFPQLNLRDRTYSQSHIPPAMQTEAVGHAVRAVYMYSGMADLAGELRDDALLSVCRRLFDDIALKQMYITGGIGSAENGERFTSAYDLPGDYGYKETCASIGLMMFASRMMRADVDSKYADVLERAFYNTVLAGISLSGTEFFYVNPLSVIPNFIKNNPNLAHVSPTRQKWFGVACCPTNIARTLASVGQYIYAYDRDTVYFNLYIANEASFDLESGEARVRVDTAYPFGDRVLITLDGDFTAALRIPSGCALKGLSLDGNPLNGYEIRKGYLYLAGGWDGSKLELLFDMPALKVRSHPRVSANAGRVALMKGPVVYCLEEADNGGNLSALSLESGTELDISSPPEGLPREADCLTFRGLRESEAGWDNALYSPADIRREPAELLAVPYCLWGNRGEGEMQVFIRQQG